MAIEGVSAYLNSIYTTHRTVSTTHKTTFGGEIKGGGTVEDVVTLSAAAQEVLKIQSEKVPLDSDGNPILDDNKTTSGGNIIAANLEGRNLAGTDLTGAALNFSNLKDANLNNTVLKDASLAKADVTGATFIGADLRGANLSGVTGLTAEQLAGARIDINTVLPIAIVTTEETYTNPGNRGLLYAKLNGFDGNSPYSDDY
ncbi:MAG: pentapeptide repeat-containing protein [Alphaproteobacteria bacterium]